MPSATPQHMRRRIEFGKSRPSFVVCRLMGLIWRREEWLSNIMNKVMLDSKGQVRVGDRKNDFFYQYAILCDCKDENWLKVQKLCVTVTRFGLSSIGPLSMSSNRFNLSPKTCIIARRQATNVYKQ